MLVLRRSLLRLLQIVPFNKQAASVGAQAAATDWCPHGLSVAGIRTYSMHDNSTAGRRQRAAVCAGNLGSHGGHPCKGAGQKYWSVQLVHQEDRGHAELCKGCASCKSGEHRACRGAWHGKWPAYTACSETGLGQEAIAKPGQLYRDDASVDCRAASMPLQSHKQGTSAA